MDQKENVGNKDSLEPIDMMMNLFGNNMAGMLANASNDSIESVLEKYSTNPRSRALAMETYETVRVRVAQGAHIIVPGIMTENKKFIYGTWKRYTGDPFTFFIGFTSAKTRVLEAGKDFLQVPLEGFLKQILNTEGIEGIVINPGKSKAFVINKAGIERVLLTVQYPEGRLEYSVGDITGMDVECIVNAANHSLLGGGGVDGAIHMAAGPELLEECRSLGGCKTGEAKLTKGYKLIADYIIHTVGPVYSGKSEDAQLLENCYRNSLDLAKKHEIHSIAFPAISTGAYGYPMEEAAQIAKTTVTNWLKDNWMYPIIVKFVSYDSYTDNIYQNAKCSEASVPKEQEEIVNPQKNVWLNGIMGLVVGDALGVPVQFMAREEIRNRPEGPVTGMEAGGAYDMPEGTWSDDSSMALATLASIIEKKEANPADIMMRFVMWEMNGEYTPFGEAFDEGNTCSNAIYKFAELPDIKTCGSTGERSNGNGALMRILPVCIYYCDRQKKVCTSDDEAIESIHVISGLTHNHLRSKMCCGIYYFMVKSIIEGVMKDKKPALADLLQEGIDNGLKYYRSDIRNLAEMTNLSRLFHLCEFKDVPEDEIKTTGYVIDSIEAAVWCLITTDTMKDCLLKAVNLGDDTDTVAAIAGGLAGLYYGYEQIPQEWLDVIKRREWIEDMCRSVAE